MLATQILAIATVLLIGPLAGMSLDQSIKQLPARHRIGVSAFSAYQRAADLGNGVYLYAGFGIGALITAIAAALGGYFSSLAMIQAMPLYVSAPLAVLHSITTAFAAPTAFSQMKYALGDEWALTKVFDRFQFWQNLRVVLQVLNFGVALWAVLAIF